MRLEVVYAVVTTVVWEQEWQKRNKMAKGALRLREMKGRMKNGCPQMHQGREAILQRTTTEMNIVQAASEQSRVLNGKQG